MSPVKPSKSTRPFNPWGSRRNFSGAFIATVKYFVNLGFDKPSAVQQRAIMPIISARDVIVQSQSGTGKTAVFCLGALQRIELGVRAPQVLVLSPTRELAEQTQKVALALGDHLNVQIHACLGGKSMQEDIRKLEMGVHMISGTPGRVFDMVQQRHLDLKKIKMFILD